MRKTCLRLVAKAADFRILDRDEQPIVFNFFDVAVHYLPLFEIGKGEETGLRCVVTRTERHLHLLLLSVDAAQEDELDVQSYCEVAGTKLPEYATAYELIRMEPRLPVLDILQRYRQDQTFPGSE
jgi:hypothetical protein